MMPMSSRESDLVLEVARLRGFETIMKRMFFLLVAFAPREWRDEAMARWMKQDEKLPLDKMYHT